MLGGAVFVTRLGAAGLDLAPTWAAFAVAALIAGVGAGPHGRSHGRRAVILDPGCGPLPAQVSTSHDPSRQIGHALRVGVARQAVLSWGGGSTPVEQQVVH